MSRVRTELYWILLAGLVACGGKEDDGDDTADTDTMADADTDTDADTDADTDTDTDTDTGMPMGDARVRVLHLSPDAPAVDVFVDDATPAAITNLAFPDGTAYVTLPAGMHNVKVSPTGGTTADAVLDLDLDFAVDTDYTAVAWDEVANIQALALVDDVTGLAAGNVRLQVTHAAAAVGQVDVWELSGPAEIIADFDQGATAVLDVPAGPLSIGLDLDDDAVPDVTFAVPALGSDILVNVFAVTDAAGNPFLLAYLPDGTTARVDPS